MPRKQRVDYAEYGVTGLKHPGGRIREEILPDLQGPKGTKKFQEMSDNDSTCSALLFAIKQFMRSATPHVNQHGDSALDKEAAELLESCLGDMSQSWTSVISSAQSMFPFGWAYLEICWKIRNGPDADPPSKYNDGFVGIRKLPIRAQTTLSKWEFDDNGGIQAMVQRAPPDFRDRVIPIEKSLLFRTEEEKGNPEGKSILRSSFMPYYYKKHIQEIEAIGIERDLAGLPVIYAPTELIAGQGDWASKKQALLNVLVNIRRDEQEGVLMPRDDKNEKAYELVLLSSGGKRQFNTSEIINRYDAAIAQPVLADFILLGHEKVGSYALFGGKRDAFGESVIGWLESMKGIFNRFLVPRLFAANEAHFGRLEELPELAFTLTKVPTIEDLCNVIKTLAAAGAELFPNLEVTNAMLEEVGLPLITKDEFEKASSGYDWLGV